MRFFAAITLLALMTSPALADLDADTKKPYQIEVVLPIAANRVFTPLFQDQLQRDVQNQLKIRFGNLARIEVTRAHPLLRDIEAKGLNAAVEGWESLSDRSTHFVLVDYAGGAYQIQARSHDGLTGQPSPLTRRTRINDRTAVAASIADIVESSFSPVGTVTAVGKGVTMKLKGGELGVKMDRWAERGQVFAVSRIFDEGTRRRGERLEWALLEIIDVLPGGVCRCRYRHRYQEDTLSPRAGTLGYRAAWLPTVESTVKVQLLDDATLQPLDGVRVRVKHASDTKTVDLLTNRDGLAVTRELFAHLAVVQVLSGETVRAQFPVELIEGRTAVARVKVDADTESLAPLEVRRDALVRRVYDNVRMSSDRTSELSAQLNQSLEAALESGRKSLPALEAEIAYLASEKDQISQLAKEKKAAYDLRDVGREIDGLRTKAKELQAFIARIEGVLKEAGGSDKTLGLHQLIERAYLLEKENDFDPAIRLYEQVVQASPDQAKIKAHLDQLKKAWATHGDKHAKARAFIYQTWPTLDVAGLEKNLDRAIEALAACRDSGDKLTPQKLLNANNIHKANLQKLLESLKRRDTEDNRNQAKSVAHITTALVRLTNEANAIIGKKD